MYYPSSENKGADQLRGYREADLRLCFRQCRLLVFPWGGSYVEQTSRLVQDCVLVQSLELGFGVGLNRVSHYGFTLVLGLANSFQRGW